MPVAFDAYSAPTKGTGNFSWTHTPVGTPRGIVVMVATDVGITDEVTAVTYGGVALSQVTGSPLLGDQGGEDGSVAIWILESGIPTGAQTVAVTVNGTGSTKGCVCVSLTTDGYDIRLSNAGWAVSANVSSSTNPGIGALTVGDNESPVFVIGVIHSGAAFGSLAVDASTTTEIYEERLTGTAANFAYRTVNLNAGAGGVSNAMGWIQTAEENHNIAVGITEDRLYVQTSFLTTPPTETDTPLAATVTKSVALGIATESDSGLAMTTGKSVAVGLSSETDAALAATATKTAAVGLVVETDEGLAATATKSVTLGIATEGDTGLAAGATKSAAVGLASETDAALAAGATKSVTLGIATETDEALAATPVQSGGGQSIALGQAVETDAALGVSITKSVAMGLAVESDLAMALYSGGEPLLGRMLTPALPMWPVGMGAVPLPAGKFRITWGYDPHGHGAWPADFQVFESPVWDVPLVDSETGLNVVAFDVRRKQFSFTTAAYPGGSSHAFGVRARSSAGVAERNINSTATVTAKTAAPSSAKIFQTVAAR